MAFRTPATPSKDLPLHPTGAGELDVDGGGLGGHPKIRVTALASFVAWVSLTELARDVGEEVVVGSITRLTGDGAVQILAGFGLAFHLVRSPHFLLHHLPPPHLSRCVLHSTPTVPLRERSRHSGDALYSSSWISSPRILAHAACSPPVCRRVTLPPFRVVVPW